MKRPRAFSFNDEKDAFDAPIDVRDVMKLRGLCSGSTQTAAEGIYLLSPLIL